MSVSETLRSTALQTAIFYSKGTLANICKLPSGSKTVLWIVIALNGAIFLVEILAGKRAGSQALQADALDFLGDSMTYGISLAVTGISRRTRAKAALFTGVSLATMGVGLNDL